jgi:nucleolar complex protein 2
MAKKGTKATRKFAASGQLTKKIQARRKQQQIQRKVHKNKSARNKKGQEHAPHVDASDKEDEEGGAKEKKSSKKRYVLFLFLSVDGTSYAYPGDTVSRACR